MSNFITITTENIMDEHICCAISDKKCVEGYALKKEWLKQEFKEGYVFKRINERAKVFIEYVPAEKAWVPISAPNYIYIGCLWVAGKYKGLGYGKQLLNFAEEEAIKQHKYGLVTIAGVKKLPFLSDGKWLKKQGFEVVEQLSSGLALYVKKLNKAATLPRFNSCTKQTSPNIAQGIVVYYTNRCPFTTYHVENILVQSAKELNLPLHINRITSVQAAQKCPTPATIFSMYYNQNFITTDISYCASDKLLKLINQQK